MKLLTYAAEICTYFRCKHFQVILKFTLIEFPDVFNNNSFPVKKLWCKNNSCHWLNSANLLLLLFIMIHFKLISAFIMLHCKELNTGYVI